MRTFGMVVALGLAISGFLWAIQSGGLALLGGMDAAGGALVAALVLWAAPGFILAAAVVAGIKIGGG